MKTSSIKSLKLDTQIEEKEDHEVRVSKGGHGGNSSWNENEWVTLGLLFELWVGLMYYVLQLAPNQTLSRDMYFLQKLLKLRGDDRFAMNEVLVALWYSLCLWPLFYSCCCFQLAKGAGLGLIGYAALASGDAWNELFQYFRESLFIHAMIIDFTLLSTFTPFWVYNDVTARGWISKGGSWLVPMALIRFVGPALYTLLSLK